MFCFIKKNSDSVLESLYSTFKSLLVFLISTVKEAALHGLQQLIGPDTFNTKLSALQ